MNLQKALTETFDFLASLKLAVIVIISIAVISAVGTIYEARYDAEVARELVYQSPYMYIVLGLLCVNLTFVMIDRWPWKKRHTGFVLAHIGIIITLVGALITQLYGIDGSVSFGIGEKNRSIVIPEREVQIFAYTQGAPDLVHRQTVNFLKHPPTKENPVVFDLGDKQFKVTDYYHYSTQKVDMLPSDNEMDGPALRVQLHNDRANFIQWLYKPLLRPHHTVNLGPAKMVLSDGSFEYSGGNVIVMTSRSDDVQYKIYTDSKKGLIKEGVAKEGDVVATGWMDLNLRILRHLPHAKEKEVYEKREQPSANTGSAMRVEFDGKERWLGMNSLVRFFTPEKLYLVKYANRLIDMGFNMKLKEFRVGRYQGTSRASSYESEVEVEGLGKRLISMNNPLKHNGLTFYQASFQEDETGQPIASILSVNHDPGRALKYFGSFLIVLGSIILFWFKRMAMRKSKPAKVS